MENIYWIEVPEKGFISTFFECSSYNELQHKAKKILINNVSFDTDITYYIRSISKNIPMKYYKNHSLIIDAYLDGEEEITHIQDVILSSDETSIHHRCNIEFKMIEDRLAQINAFKKLISTYLSTHYIEMVDFLTGISSSYTESISNHDREFILNVLEVREQHYKIRKSLDHILPHFDRMIEDLNKRYRKVCNIVLLFIRQ